MIRKCLLLLILACAAPLAQAVEYEDVEVPDSVTLAGQEVPLNGVGLREVVWVNVYVGALYLPEQATTTEAAVSQAGPKRIAMYFVHDAEREKIVEAWNEGFANNNPPETVETIRNHIEQFNGWFGDVKEGDVIFLDYLPEEGTRVTINGEVKGSIPGKAFNDALLRIWLGPKPPGGNLREGMLGDY